MIDSRDSNEATATYDIELTKTGGWQTYETKTIDLGGEPLTGVHDVYIVFNGQMNVDWWQFKEKNDTPDPVLPTAPQNFTAAAGDGEAALSWSAPANSGDVSAITKYEVSSDNGESWVDAASNTGHTFTGLTNGTEYTFQVRAVNADGNGAAATVKATPMAPIITGWPYETRIANEFDAVYPNKDRNPNFQSQPMKWENNSNIGYTTNGDTLVFTDVNFGSRGADKFIAEVAAGVSQGSQGPCAGKIIVKVDCTVAENASYTGIKDASILKRSILAIPRMLQAAQRLPYWRLPDTDLIHISSEQLRLQSLQGLMMYSLSLNCRRMARSILRALHSHKRVWNLIRSRQVSLQNLTLMMRRKALAIPAKTAR